MGVCCECYFELVLDVRLAKIGNKRRQMLLIGKIENEEAILSGLLWCNVVKKWGCHLGKDMLVMVYALEQD